MRLQRMNYSHIGAPFNKLKYNICLFPYLCLESLGIYAQTSISLAPKQIVGYIYVELLAMIENYMIVSLGPYGLSQEMIPIAYDV